MLFHFDRATMYFDGGEGEGGGRGGDISDFRKPLVIIETSG